MTTTDTAMREFQVLIEPTSQIQAKKSMSFVQSKNQGVYVKIVNNCITTQDNEKLHGWGRL
jgi:hypothetical protein